MVSLGQVRIYKVRSVTYTCRSCKKPIETGFYITSYKEFRKARFTSNFHPICFSIFAMELIEKKEGSLNKPRGIREPRKVKDPQRVKLLRRRNYLINKLLNWELTDDEQLEIYDQLINISKDLILNRDMDKRRSASDILRLGLILNEIKAKKKEVEIL